MTRPGIGPGSAACSEKSPWLDGPPPSPPIDRKTVVVIRTMSKMTRPKIEELGGKASGSVSKLDKADELGAEVINEREFMARYVK